MGFCVLYNTYEVYAADAAFWEALMEGMEKRADRRVLRTKKAIYNAFAKLLSEKELDEITMTEIAETANINRKTLYNYYSGLYQLVDEVEDMLLDAFDEAVYEADFRAVIREPSGFFGKMTEILMRDPDFYGSLFRMSGNAGLSNKLTELFKARARQAILSRGGQDEFVTDVVVDYAVSGMMAVYRSWFGSGRRQPIDELSELVHRICVYGALSVLDKESET